MSKDIRSYFSAAGSKKPAQSASKIAESPIVKRKAVVISSDEDEVPSTPSEQPTKPSREHKKKRRISDSDDEVPSTPSEKPTKPSRGHKKKRRISDSDDEAPKPKQSPKKKPDLKKLDMKTDKKDEHKKAVDVFNLFGSEPARVKRPQPAKEPQNDIEDDVQLLEDDFDASIAQLDESHFEGEQKCNPSSKESQKEEKSDKGKKTTTISPAKPSAKSESKSPSHSKTSLNVTPTKESDAVKRKIEKSPLSDLGLNHTSSENPQPSTSPKSKVSKKVDLESSVLSDEERHERKRLTAVLYQKYKNRQSVLNPGSKEVPKGKPNCLAGLTFLVTGILESIDREEANTLIKDHGGKVSSTVGKRLNYLVVGEEAGPKKLATAQDLGIKIISEDDLFDLIREKSGQVDANKNATSSSPKKHEETKKLEEAKKHIPNSEEKKQIKHEAVETKTATKRKHDDSQKVKQEKTGPSPMKMIKKEEGVSAVVDVDERNMAWVDKYKPGNIKQIIGQQGAASNCVKLTNWLTKWHSNHDGKKKLQRPNPWAKNDDGSYYKAALLSGPPGVGKTTTATLVCKELGFDTVEFNASDTRNKKLLKAEVSELLSSKSLYGYFHGDKVGVSKNHVLIMDEVDGMAGNEDRGGIQELISLIKDSSVPIICMCNDRSHPKMRSLVNYCYDLRFNKPRLEQIRGAMMSVCFKEKFKITPGKLEEIISATNNDIRQTLNHLSLLSAGKDIELEKSGTKSDTAKKDLKLGPWEVVRKVFSADEHKTMSLNDKADLFFNDYSMGPLFVQENYLSVLPKVPKPQIPRQVALTANSLSLGDLIDRRIRSSSAWTLLPVQAMFSSVMPGEYMAGHFTGQINFPGWLGKNSKRNKRSRMAQELHDHTRIKTSGSRMSIRLDYAPFLLNAILLPLKTKGLDGVSDALEVIKEYRLLREDLESLIELTSWPGKKNPMDSIDGKIKAALTRAYNKEVLAYSYSAMAGIKKKRAEAQNELEGLEEEEGEAIVIDDDEENEEEKLENDALIKAKKPTAQKASAKADSKKSTAGSSKPKAGSSKSKK